MLVPAPEEPMYGPMPHARPFRRTTVLQRTRGQRAAPIRVGKCASQLLSSAALADIGYKAIHLGRSISMCGG